MPNDCEARDGLGKQLFSSDRKKERIIVRVMLLMFPISLLIAIAIVFDNNVFYASDVALVIVLVFALAFVVFIPLALVYIIFLFHRVKQRFTKMVLC
jgi:hypothetical protein